MGPAGGEGLPRTSREPVTIPSAGNCAGAQQQHDGLRIHADFRLLGAGQGHGRCSRTARLAHRSRSSLRLLRAGAPANLYRLLLTILLLLWFIISIRNGGITIPWSRKRTSNVHQGFSGKSNMVIWSGGRLGGVVQGNDGAIRRYRRAYRASSSPCPTEGNNRSSEQPFASARVRVLEELPDAGKSKIGSIRLYPPGLLPTLLPRSTDAECGAVWRSPWPTRKLLRCRRCWFHGKAWMTIDCSGVISLWNQSRA